MSQTQLTLKWEPLTRAQDLLRSDNGVRACRSVCIWGFRLPEPGVGGVGKRFIPYWVGRTRNFRTRLKEHLGCLKGGCYTLYHPDDLHELQKHTGRKPSGRGPVYVPDTPRAVMEFHANAELQRYADFMVDCFHFSYAELPVSVESDLAEREVADRIGRDRLGTLIRGERVEPFLDHRCERNNEIEALLRNRSQ